MTLSRARGAVFCGLLGGRGRGAGTSAEEVSGLRGEKAWQSKAARGCVLGKRQECQRGDNCQGLGSLQEPVPSLCAVSPEQTEKGMHNLQTGVCDWES